MKDFSQTVNLCHHLHLSYDGTVVKTPRTSIPKRAEIFSTKSSKEDGEQDQKRCVIGMLVKVATGDLN